MSVDAADILVVMSWPEAAPTPGPPARRAARVLARSRSASAILARLAPGGGGVLCPICETRARRFAAFGAGPVVRPDARCRTCGSLERHRLLWLYLRDATDLLAGGPVKRVLHVAPEPALRERLAAAPGLDYLSAELEPGLADVEMDLTAIDRPAASFDVVICSHVLEHIPDDARAMRELRRVLAPDGWAILQVPILREITDEDPTVSDPEERLRRFAQRDHVRVYGRDYADRLRRAGFRVREDRYAARLGPELISRHGLVADEVVHFCTAA